jgi:hypothetical protein
MEDNTLKQHAYAVTIAVQTLVEAMGMHAENQQRIRRCESLAYGEKAFIDLINKNGCHHNGVLSLQWNL